MTPSDSDMETTSSVGSAAGTTDVVHMKVSVYSFKNVLWTIDHYFTSAQRKPDLAVATQEEAAGEQD